jgi:hypothetical protein
VTARLLDREELYASKLVAALDRQHPRDLFDVLGLFEDGGITPRMRRAFVVYLAGHNRPMHELLPPNRKDLQRAFENEFVGMTKDPVALEGLLTARERLIAEIPETLDEKERRFLLSLKSLQPDWSLLELPNIERLPALQWKLKNLENLAARNAAKHKMMLENLKKCLNA